MEGNDLKYWEWFLEQREEDLALEQARNEDDYLVKCIKLQIEEAKNKITELS